MQAVTGLVIFVATDAGFCIGCTQALVVECRRLPFVCLVALGAVCGDTLVKPVRRPVGLVAGDAAFST